MANDKRQTTNGKRQTANGKRQTANGKLGSPSKESRVQSDKPQGLYAHFWRMQMAVR